MASLQNVTLTKRSALICQREKFLKGIFYNPGSMRIIAMAARSS
jgi:hypothetical protein